MLLLFAASCAQILTPGGGPKDTTPPHVVDYSPDSAAKNFTGKRIVLRFDEYVQLTDINNQLIVSPPMNTPPDVTIRKKEIIIDLNDSLLPNTTYTISFGNAISDITEKNVLDNFRYVFSTGSVIDSLKISGSVVNASSLGAEKGIYVMLYKTNGDSVPLKQKPYYFTKTRADGSFLFTNLKAGNYKLFALDDKNSNYVYDNTEERVAFADQPINLTQDLDSVNLRLFKEQPTKQKLVKGSQIGTGKFLFVYALPMKHPKITAPHLPPSSEMYSEYSTNGDSINVWINNLTADSVLFQVEDSRAIIDSVKIIVAKTTNRHGRGTSSTDESHKLKLAANSNSGGLFDLGKPLIITASNPLKSFNAKDFILMKGKDTLKTDISLSENKRFLSFTYKFEEDSIYTLFVKPGAAVDCFNQKNDTLKSKFKIQKADYYGTLSIKLTGLPAGNYQLQLLNEKGEAVREMKVAGEPSVKFEMLPPGQYSLKLIADTNKNEKWDTGNYLAHVQPEKVIFYAGLLKMRSGWDMDVEWIFK